MENSKLKTPLTYYGGKQKLASKIISLIPNHKLYCEPFVGGAAVFFSKAPSAIEVLNDTNTELINFYKVVQQQFVDLEKEIRITLHSRNMHRDAFVIYENPHLFNTLQRAWAVWVRSSQSFSAMMDGSWGYDKAKNATTKKITNQKDRFTEELAIRLQNVQLECADALYVIRSRDSEDAFIYCDPPYFNSDCGHYNGYAEHDFENLLRTLNSIKGKFLLSSYPSKVLEKYSRENGWSTIKIEQQVSVNKGKGKKKVEVLTANYELK